MLSVCACRLNGWLGEPQEEGEDTFLSSKEMDNRPLGSNEQFSGIISSDPDFSLTDALTGVLGASRSTSSLELEGFSVQGGPSLVLSDIMAGG